jgi:hypothetical protein
LTITGGSSLAAMIFKALPQFEDPFEQPGPAHHRDRSNTSGGAKKAHAFARVEDVTLCPSQD